MQEENVLLVLRVFIGKTHCTLRCYEEITADKCYCQTTMTDYLTTMTLLHSEKLAAYFIFELQMRIWTALQRLKNIYFKTVVKNQELNLNICALKKKKKN